MAGSPLASDSTFTVSQAPAGAHGGQPQATAAEPQPQPWGTRCPSADQAGQVNVQRRPTHLLGPSNLPPSPPARGIYSLGGQCSVPMRLAGAALSGELCRLQTLSLGQPHAHLSPQCPHL